MTPTLPADRHQRLPPIRPRDGGTECPPNGGYEPGLGVATDAPKGLCRRRQSGEEGCVGISELCLRTVDPVVPVTLEREEGRVRDRCGQRLVEVPVVRGPDAPRSRGGLGRRCSPIGRPEHRGRRSAVTRRAWWVAVRPWWRRCWCAGTADRAWCARPAGGGSSAGGCWTARSNRSSSDGAVVQVTSVGSGPGVVIVHGGGVTASMYRRLAERLSGRLTVHLIARRAFRPVC